MIVYLDTMVAVWLVEDGMQWRLSTAAKRAVEQSESLLISPMAVFELKAIYRKKRILTTPAEVLLALETRVDVRVCKHPFIDVAIAAMAIDWTTDPGDAMIVGHAMANGNAPLITSDRNIRAHYAAAIW